LDIRKVKKLIELLEESGIAEIEIKEGEEAVRISRMPTGPMVSHMAPTYMQAPVAAAPAPVAAAAPAAPPVPAPRGAKEHVVTAPMVGTFYGSASPGAKPFVEIGSEVKEGQVTAIMATNGDPVEFGQPLFVIE
jgi:acetyl-CoA carboxylase biotin carboxyl carrier protein